MVHFSVRMLWLCLLVATALNLLEYILMRFYNTDGKTVSKYYYPKTESGMETPRSLVYSEEIFKSISYNNYTNANLIEIFNNNKTINTTSNTEVIGEVPYCPELPPGLGQCVEHNGTPLIECLRVLSPVTSPNLTNNILYQGCGNAMLDAVYLANDEDIIPTKVANARQFDIKYSEVKVGGIYKPSTCRSRQSVAIIIAYRGSKKSLKTFLLFLHPFLVKQQLDYQIFVVRQSNNTQHFNRGMLLNIGFTEAQKRRQNRWNCIIFHEAHIVPTDSRNLYRCSWYPRQLAVFVERPLLSEINHLLRVDFRFPYVPKFGGAVALTPEQFLKVNGFSNKYWGNDAEFEDLYNRLLKAHYFIEHSLPNLGSYKTLDNYTGAIRIKSEYMLRRDNGRFPLYLKDGLTSLAYKREIFQVKRMHTYIKVHIDDANDTENYRLFRGNIPIQLA